MANPSSDDTFFYISELSNISLVVDKQRQTVHITAIDREIFKETERQTKQEKKRQKTNKTKENKGQTVHITAIDRETQRDTKTKRQIKQEKTRKYLSIKKR